jgi:hypothetical protein
MAPADDNPFAARYVTALQVAGVTPDAQGLRAYLALHHPGADQQQQYRDLLAHLGDDDFFQREKAMKQLIQMPAPLTNELQQAVGSLDPEIRWRARVVLEESQRPHEDLLSIAFIVIHDRKLHGLAGPVLGAIPVCDEHQFRLAERALLSTLAPDDADLLRRHLYADDVRARVAAVSALSAALGGGARTDLQPLLDDSSDLVRVAAARALLATDRPAALRTLAALLDSPVLSVRRRSIQLLRSQVRVKVPYQSDDSDDRRSQAAAVWRDAIETHLRADPAPSGSNSPPDVSGRVLVSRLAGDEILHVQRDEGVVFHKVAPGWRGVRLLSDAHCLICRRDAPEVAELDEFGEAVWSISNLPAVPTDMERLANGNTLVCTEEGDLIEYDAELVKVWESREEWSARLVRSTPEGGVLVLLARHRGELIEFNRFRELVSRTGELRLDRTATSVCLDANGWLLVGTTDRIFRLGRDGGLTALPARFEKLRQIDLSVDGECLVLDIDGVHLIDVNGHKYQTIVFRRGIECFDSP